MRKILIILLILVLGLFSYMSFTEGMSVFGAQIISYNEVQSEYAQLDNIIENINKKSTVDFESKKTNLSKAYNELKNLKETYEEKVYKNMSSTSDKNIFVYDIDFLWARIGSHATEDGVDIDLDIAENSSGTTAIGNYALCDFYFTVRGEYVDITTFIYHLEDDEELSFSIENFKLVPTEKTLSATFKVPEMPLNKDNLTVIGTALSTNKSDTATTENSTNTNTTNSTTNTVTNTTTNTVSNTTTNTATNTTNN